MFPAEVRREGELLKPSQAAKAQAGMLIPFVTTNPMLVVHGGHPSYF